jgi:hypothetical protein
MVIRLHAHDQAGQPLGRDHRSRLQREEQITRSCTGQVREAFPNGLRAVKPGSYDLPGTYFNLAATAQRP